MSERETTSAVSAWDPFRELDIFPRWSPFRGASPLQGLLDERAARWAPSMDISEDDDQFTITVELAGGNKDDVTLEIHENVLTIRGEKRSEREDKNEQRRYVERSYGSFSRSFGLPANANADGVHASFKDGVLTVTVPKREEAKPKAIAVK